MTRIAGCTHFNRPVEDLFDFLADPRDEPLYNPVVLSAEKVTAGPIGKGTRFVQRAKSFRKAGKVDIEVTSYDRPEHLSYAIRLAGMDVKGELTFRPKPPGCDVFWTWELRPRGPWKLLGPLVGAAGSRLERRVWDQMKSYVDARETLVPPARNDADDSDGAESGWDDRHGRSSTLIASR